MLMTVFLSFNIKNKSFLYLNSKHPNIPFTHEVENNGSLLFLCINIIRLLLHLCVLQTNLNKHSSTKCSRLNHLFIPALLKRLFSFAFHTLANMVTKYANNFTNFFLSAYPHVSICFVFCPTCRLSAFSI